MDIYIFLSKLSQQMKVKNVMSHKECNLGEERTTNRRLKGLFGGVFWGKMDDFCEVPYFFLACFLLLSGLNHKLIPNYYQNLYYLDVINHEDRETASFITSSSEADLLANHNQLFQLMCR